MPIDNINRISSFLSPMHLDSSTFSLTWSAKRVLLSWRAQRVLFPQVHIDYIDDHLIDIIIIIQIINFIKFSEFAI